MCAGDDHAVGAARGHSPAVPGEPAGNGGLAEPHEGKAQPLLRQHRRQDHHPEQAGQAAGQ